MKKTLLIILAVTVLSLALLGCSTEKYGLGIDKTAPEVKVKDIFLNSNLRGGNVTLEGRIASQCGSNGCWFVLQDGTGQIFINLAPSNITLPPRMGMTARVTGAVYSMDGQLQIVARGVEVK